MMISGQELGPLEDVIIALLSVEGSSGKQGEPVNGIVRLTKELFLLSRTPAFHDQFKGVRFERDNYGPFSDAIDTAIDELVARELITMTGKDPYQFHPTIRGIRCGKAVIGKMNNEQIANLIDVKRNFNSLPLSEILKRIYSLFPEYRPVTS
jgi:hypothetical protein